jgi:hypothetical protein
MIHVQGPRSLLGLLTLEDGIDGLSQSDSKYNSKKVKQTNSTTEPIF